MPPRRINPRLIKLHRPYSVEEAASALDVHKNSVRRWIKQGLPVVDKSRPVLMLGHVLRAHLESTRKAAKRPCPPGTIYCFKCRASMRPALGMVEFIPRNTSTGNLNALCEACGTTMHRNARADRLAAIMPNLDVQIREAGERLIDRHSPSLNCNKQKD